MKKNVFSLLAIFSIMFFSVNAVAAPVAINSMFVNNASVTLDAGYLGSATASSALPNIEITMGSYQPDIFSVGADGLNVRVYSTDASGMNAPSGYVDGTLINVDFSSFRAEVTYSIYSFDVGLWPINTELDYGTYDPMNNNYLIGWSEAISIDVSSIFSQSATLDVSLSGYLTAVPVPAAIWLFGSGFIALFGFVRSKK